MSAPKCTDAVYKVAEQYGLDVPYYSIPRRVYDVRVVKAVKRFGSVYVLVLEGINEKYGYYALYSLNSGDAAEVLEDGFCTW